MTVEPNPLDSLPPGTVFADYRIERLLGRGGTSGVYSAYPNGGVTLETLKILGRTASASIRTRFADEAHVLAQMHHRNIVAVNAAGEFDGQLWMSLQYIDGYSAARLVARGQIPLDVHRAARIIDAVSAALDYAHGLGVVHRDVKPANILISTGDNHIVLSDWGIARSIDDSRPLVSDDGTVLSSIAYAAPELLRGDAVTPQTDVYALGATIVELFTGRTVFPLATPAAVIEAQLRRTPPTISRRRLDLPRQLDAVVQRAMAKDPRDRFASCQETSAAVARALESYEPPPPPRRPWYRRR